MLTHTSRWSHPRGNEVVPSRWQATPVAHAHPSSRETQLGRQPCRTARPSLIRLRSRADNEASTLRRGDIRCAAATHRPPYLGSSTLCQRATTTWTTGLRPLGLASTRPSRCAKAASAV